MLAAGPTGAAAIDVPLVGDPQRLVVADFGPTETYQSHQLYEQETLTLAVRGLPESGLVLLEQESNEVAVTLSVEGTAIFKDLRLAPGTLRVSVPAASWSRTLDVSTGSRPELRPPTLPIVPTGPPPVGTLSGDPSTSIWDSEEISYGHWRMSIEWYRVDNDGDSANRYYRTVTRWFGLGSTDPDPYHVFSDLYHMADGYRVNGNTWVRDFEPLDENPGGDKTWTVGLPPSIAYSWNHERPATFRYYWTDDGDADFDRQRWHNEQQFEVDPDCWWPPCSNDPWYRNKIEVAAEGVIPTGSWGYAWVRTIHHSRTWAWGTTYYDDTGWIYSPVTWA